MDFNQLRKSTNECNSKLNAISEKYNISFENLKILCREISFNTKYTYLEAINVVSNNLINSLSINDIIMKYDLDKELF